MESKAYVTFKIESWDEKTYDEYEGGRKLTRAALQKTCTGDFIGEGSLEYLMVYIEEGSASFVGVERLEGCLGNKSGSFVLQHTGTYAGGISKATLHVIPGSATGELEGLSGEGSFEFGHSPEYSFTLNYTS